MSTKAMQSFVRELHAWEESGEPMKKFIMEQCLKYGRKERAIYRWVRDARMGVERRQGFDRRHNTRDDLDRRENMDRRA